MNLLVNADGDPQPCVVPVPLGQTTAVGTGGIGAGNYGWNTVKLLMKCKAAPFIWVLYWILFSHILYAFWPLLPPFLI